MKLTSLLVIVLNEGEAGQRVETKRIRRRVVAISTSMATLDQRNVNGITTLSYVAPSRVTERVNFCILFNYLLCSN